MRRTAPGRRRRNVNQPRAVARTPAAARREGRPGRTGVGMSRTVAFLRRVLAEKRVVVALEALGLAADAGLYTLSRSTQRVSRSRTRAGVRLQPPPVWKRHGGASRAPGSPRTR